MTQGDQQHPTEMTGAAGSGSSCPEDADAAERGSSSPQEERDRIAMEDRLHHAHQHHFTHHHQQPPEQTTAADGDVKTLLHFVSLASSDIKAALDKSAPSNARKSSSVDNINRKFPQKQLLKKSPISNFTGSEVYRGDDPYFNSRRFAASLNSPQSPGIQSGALHFSERLMASASLHRDHLIKNSDLLKELTFGSGIRRDLDQPLFGRRGSTRYHDHRRSAGLSGREFTDMAKLDRSGEAERPDSDNPLPLRKRRLPASFWQEPDRSENHKTIPSTITGLSPVNLSSNLKFPNLLPSLAQGFTDSRPTSLDKNAIYPSGDQCYSGLNLPFPPPLSNSLNRDNYLNRALNFQYSSICSCSQHTELYSYEHGPACAAYAARHGGETPGIFNPISATGLLSRWHVPSQLTTERAGMCHPSAPRVVKPIPTKSITSYPPRYHPIYT
ncbi:uncharacterized protein LOC119740239 [Patiria miniata]|uniref:Uncharacterized protein n=1 Tax=Patiria miniata TaxID=46514 RepID=A0A914B590_PATMI|nr:uncharacterized protein LOC119740239 [Patiria miniata]